MFSKLTVCNGMYYIQFDNIKKFTGVFSNVKTCANNQNVANFIQEAELSKFCRKAHANAVYNFPSPRVPVFVVLQCCCCGAGHLHVFADRTMSAEAAGAAFRLCS